MAILITIQAVAIVLLGVLVAGLLRSHAEILRSLHRLGAGLHGENTDSVQPAASPVRTSESSEVFDVAGTTPSDDAITIGVRGVEHDTLLAFLSSGCLTCSVFWEAFNRDRLTVPGGARLVVVTKGSHEESVSTIRRLSPDHVPVVMSSEAWADYEVPVAPYFIYVEGRSGKVVGEGASQTWEQMASLLGRALDDARPSSPGQASRVRRRRVQARQADAAREARADRDLMAAGIHPGDSSLYHQPPPQAPGEGE